MICDQSDDDMKEYSCSKGSSSQNKYMLHLNTYSSLLIRYIFVLYSAPVINVLKNESSSVKNVHSLSTQHLN